MAASESPIRVGVVGVGRGRTFMNAASLGFRLVAVCDTWEEKLRSEASRWGVEAYTDFDRFLEHARVFCFRDGGRNPVFIASADGMTRNLDKRVELLVPVVDEACRRKLLDALAIYFTDNRKASILSSDGAYRRLAPRGREKPCRSQRALHEAALAAARLVEQAKPTMLEPYQRQRKPAE